MISEIRNINLRDGEQLHAQIIENGSPLWLIVTHGLGEHSGRHKHFFELYSQYFNILVYDLRGHGKSSGKKGWVNQFEDYADDLVEVVKYLQDEFQMKRYIVFGHSMGGLITSSFMQKKAPSILYPEKVILSSPAVSAAGVFGKLFKISPFRLTRFLSTFPLSVPIAGLLDIKKLSHDALVYEEYVKDPLNTLNIHTHLFFQLIQEAREVFAKPLNISCELNVIIGTGDVLVGAPQCIDYFSKVEKNANLQVVENGYHELHNEIEKYRKPFMDFLRSSLLGEESV